MHDDAREHRLARAFVALADTLVDDFDLVEFLNMLAERCVALLDVAEAAVILVARDGKLRVAAASSERAELLELFAVHADDGPSVDCVRDGAQVASRNLEDDAYRWPDFALAARQHGFRAAHALPMRLRGQVIGALTLLNVADEGVAPDSVALGQAFADVATVSILQQRTIERGEQLSGQLQAALDSRVVIEQAKGRLAERGGLAPDDAFTRLRGYARTANQRLSQLAHAVVAGSVDLDAILAYPVAARP